MKSIEHVVSQAQIHYIFKYIFLNFPLQIIINILVVKN